MRIKFLVLVLLCCSSSFGQVINSNQIGVQSKTKFTNQGKPIGVYLNVNYNDTFAELVFTSKQGGEIHIKVPNTTGIQNLFLPSIGGNITTQHDVDSMIMAGGGTGSDYVPITGSISDVNLGIYGLVDEGRNLSINPNDRILYDMVGHQVLSWFTDFSPSIGDINSEGNGTVLSIDDGNNMVSVSGNLDLRGDLIFNKQYQTITLHSGSNATSGIETLISGEVTIETTSVSSNDLIFLTYNSPIGVLASGLSSASHNIIDGTSFKVTSLNANGTKNSLDNSTFYWWIIHVQ